MASIFIDLEDFQQSPRDEGFSVGEEMSLFLAHT